MLSVLLVPSFREAVSNTHELVEMEGIEKGRVGLNVRRSSQLCNCDDKEQYQK